MQLKKLKNVLLPGTTDPTPEEKETAFSELIQFLEVNSMALIMRDAHDDGWKAFKKLRNHYVSSGKLRIITLYNQISSLVMQSSGTVTEYIIRGEMLALALRTNGEEVIDHCAISKRLINQDQVLIQI